MNDESRNHEPAAASPEDWHNAKDAPDVPSMPALVDRDVFEARIEALRMREKAHTHEADAIAAARRRLPAVEIDATTP